MSEPQYSGVRGKAKGMAERSTRLTTEPSAWTVDLAMIKAFEESAARHWSDGMLLAREQRHANANQLIGFAAERAIKTAWSELPGFAPEGELALFRAAFGIERRGGVKSPR